MPGLSMKTIPIDLILNILNIVIFYIIIRFIVYKPVKKFMTARTQRINDMQKNAEQAQKQADEIKAQYDELISKSEQASNEIVMQGEKKAAQEAAKIIEQANLKAEQLVKKAREKTDDERAETVAAMKADTVGFAIDISEKILARQIKDSDNRRIAEDFFDTVSKNN